jgi:hypothetical protein
MIQEIITYMIIASAILAAVLKTFKKKKKPERKKSGINFSAESLSMTHNCNQCAAECVLRNSIKTEVNQKSSPCGHIAIKSDRF